jgi:hypothetical protein
MSRRPRKKGTIDPVKEASYESFPASDPPGWLALHPGRPSAARDSDPAERDAWNAALEKAASTVERAKVGVPKERLSAKIRSMKRPMR